MSNIKDLMKDDTGELAEIIDATVTYINEIFQKGYEYGRNSCNEQEDIDDAYQQGLADAWNIAKRICGMSINGLEACGFGKIKNYNADHIYRILDTISPSEAMEKLKNYKSGPCFSEDIEVGDEILISGKKMIITELNENPLSRIASCAMDRQGNIYGLRKGEGEEKAVYRKTGRHFDDIPIMLYNSRQ